MAPDHPSDADRSITSPDPANPADHSLLGVLRTLDEDGYRGQFQAVEDVRIRCLTCRVAFDAGRVHADEATRLEGASDPADMMMVVPVRCPECATNGSLVLAYGPDAPTADGDVLAALERQPAEGDLSRPASPGVQAGLPKARSSDPGDSS